MAGKVPFSSLSEGETSHDRNIGSPSSSYELFTHTSDVEYLGNIRPVTRNESESTGCASELSFYQQLQEQYNCAINQCLGDLNTIKRKREATFIQIKKIIQVKVDAMLKAVRQSFEQMHKEGTRKLQVKCEEIGRVLAKVEKMLEEDSQDVSMDENGEESIDSQHFLNKMLQEKQKIEIKVESLIQEINKKRETDEQMYMEFMEDIQQKVQAGLSRIERSLESQAENQARTVEDKISELRRALANLQHLSKCS